jgi:hypothetical protein
MAADGPMITQELETTTAHRLTRTPDGWRAFSSIFLAKLGAPLRASLKAGLESEHMLATDLKQQALFEHIHDKLMVALQHEGDLVAELALNFPDCNGVKEFFYLQQFFSGQTMAKDVSMIFNIVNQELKGDCVADVKRMISSNQQMSEKFSDKLLATLIISKLPSHCNTMRDILIERETVPTCSAIVQKLEQRAILHPSTDDPLIDTTTNKFAFMISPHTVCYNCNSKGKHFTRDCDQPPAGCDYCGDKAYHKTEHCLVPNDKPLPSSWKPERKEAMEKKRKEYKEMKATTSSVNIATTEPSLAQLRALVEGNISLS